jgi:hypothetical protein
MKLFAAASPLARGTGSISDYFNIASRWKLRKWGNADRICTSHVERQNLTMRMMMLRPMRLKNAFSKKWDTLRLYARALLR